MVISNHNSFWVLFDKIASIYFSRKIYSCFSIGNGLPAQGTSTVPVVSTHFRCLLLQWQTANTEVWLCQFNFCNSIQLILIVPSVLWHCWLGVRKSIRPVKNRVMRCWCGYLSGARCRLFAYGPADATAIPKPHHLLPHSNPDWFYLSGTGLPRLSWKRGR